MKILFIGDVHGNSTNLHKCFEYAKQNSCELMFQVGDFGFGFPNHHKKYLNDINSLCKDYKIPLYFIRGNHDNPEMLKYDKITEIRNNFFYVPDGVEFSFDGINFIGYGGAYSIDKKNRIPGVSWWHDEEISMRSVLESCQKKADVIISHDVPYTSNIQDLVSLMPILEAEGNRKKLQAIVEEIKPKFLIHGHYHVNIISSANYTVDDIVTYFPCKGLGYDGWFMKQNYIFDTEEFKKEYL